MKITSAGTDQRKRAFKVRTRKGAFELPYAKLAPAPSLDCEVDLVEVEGQGWFLSFHCFTKYVKVTFFRGASLHPLPPGESKHEEVRYLDIHEDDQLDEDLLKTWIRQAAALPGWVP